ncbi:hypothetical protein P152DRAFT_482442 [Eremomyces bilateralis CBS 781.70]|uniref:Ribosomal protein S15 n=1 Tax=Eremomyces bilateralis CBS 781.70 TaxID=1392243 RepID=A0A6G1G1R6_9PEZI|nr:uncharacterized protein P152DRAFT_482442 [Eremomyces bilateralis CBS 781.70]KAF1811866.1 hypothetical protein P152DRAFT_482442 [Eremomyces bilateralis CBS 781.70]
MPPRICMRSLLDGLNASLTTTSRLPIRTFSSTSPISAAARKKRKHATLDRYAAAQLERNRLANRTRQAELRAEDALAAGDPVHGRPTPFVESFDAAIDLPDLSPDADSPPAPPAARLKHFFDPDEIEQTLSKAQHLAHPINTAPAHPGDTSPFAELLENHTLQHQTATEAIARITSLTQANNEDLLRVNIQRCIDVFGRHSTDSTLPRKALAASPGPNLSPAAGRRDPAPVPRAGPDTGSSEVQIAILTAKIRAVANALETRGTTDKVTKRDLRLLVHRRQKLLQYLRRKERGGPRWVNVIEKLGLTEATWKGEISL